MTGTQRHVITPRKHQQIRRSYWMFAAILLLGLTDAIPLPPSHAIQPIVKEIYQRQVPDNDFSQQTLILTHNTIEPLTPKALEQEQLEPLVITPPRNHKLPHAKNRHPRSEHIFSSSLLDIYFDTRHQFLSGGASAALKEASRLLMEHPNWKLQIQSYCDDRGSTAYNLVLGARYTQHVREFFVHLGVPTHRIATTNYGAQRQWCDGPSAKCQSENIRLQHGFQVLSQNHTRLGCFARVRSQTRQGENDLKLNRPSLTFLQPLHLAQSK